MFVYREVLSLAVRPAAARGREPREVQLRHRDWLDRCDRAHNKADIIIASSATADRHRAGAVRPRLRRFRNLETAEYIEGG
jgi:hypothetical protein